MTYNKIIRINIYLILFIAGCTSNKKNEIHLHSFLNNYGINHQTGKYVYLFIPIDGCGSCIRESISFAKANGHLLNLIIIPSDIGKKTIKLKFHGINLDQDNILIDSTSYAISEGLITTYPIAYFLYNDNLRAIVPLPSGKNINGFKEIINFLKE